MRSSSSTRPLALSIFSVRYTVTRLSFGSFSFAIWNKLSASRCSPVLSISSSSIWRWRVRRTPRSFSDPSVESRAITKSGELSNSTSPRTHRYIGTGADQPGAATSLLVVDYDDFLIHSRGRSHLGQHSAAGGSGQRALIHILTVLLPGDIEAVGAVLRDHAGPSGRPHRARGGVVLPAPMS